MATSTPNGSMRRRTGHACDRCRVMRTKCSGGSRCTKCVKDDSTCQYGDRKRERNRKDLMECHGRVHRLENTNRNLLAALQMVVPNVDLSDHPNVDFSKLIHDHTNREPERLQDSSSGSCGSQSLEAMPDYETSPSTKRSTSVSFHDHHDKLLRSGLDTPESLLASPSLNNFYLQNEERYRSANIDARTQELIHTLGDQLSDEWIHRDDNNALTLRANPSWLYRLPQVLENPTHNTSENQPSKVSNDSIIAPGAVRSFGNLAMSDAIRANRYPAAIQARQLSVIHGRFETCLPLHSDLEMTGIAKIASDSVFSFQNVTRCQISRGKPARTVLSMDSFDIDLFSGEKTPDDLDTVAKWACAWGGAWTGFSLELRYAAIHYAGSFMRWFIMPCRETYMMMSPAIRPLLCQLLIPHTVDIDLWGASPVMREIQLLHGRGLLDHVTESTQRLCWNRGPEACTERFETSCDVDSPGAVTTEPGCHTRVAERLSPAFVECIDRADTWSFHRDLLRKMPELQGRVDFYDC